MKGLPVITLLTFLPLIGGVMVAGLGQENRKVARNLALTFSFLALALALGMWRSFDPLSGAYQFEERHGWIQSLGVDYRVAVDGLGLLMVLLTAIVAPMAMLAARSLFAVPSPRDEGVGRGTGSGVSERSRRLSPPLSSSIAGREGADSRNPQLYYALVLFLQSGLFGTFTALNFFHWFIFWELSLIPAFFLVRLWGGPNRAAAATQFFVYTMVGSIALLLSFLALFLATGTFDLVELADLARNGRLAPALGAAIHLNPGGQTAATVIFLGAFLGFAVKVPLIPFHTWLPATYAEAPSATTMLLTGAMSKMGVYGFLRILLPIFPDQMQALRTPLLVLAVVTIVFSAGAAFAQKDLKRILAYSSINHLGYCLLGVFAVATSGSQLAQSAVEKAAALNGVFLQMFNHGLTAAALFWFISLIEHRSGGLRGLNDFGGLRKVAPVLCGLMGIALFSSLGLPGLNGFAGEFLIFKGVFPLATCSASLSVIGLLITAIFILTILQRVFNGPLNEKWSTLPDLTTAERAMLSAPIALMFVLGVWPQLVLGFTNPTVVRMVEQLRF